MPTGGHHALAEVMVRVVTRYNNKQFTSWICTTTPILALKRLRALPSSPGVDEAVSALASGSFRTTYLCLE